MTATWETLPQGVFRTPVEQLEPLDPMLGQAMQLEQAMMQFGDHQLHGNHGGLGEWGTREHQREREQDEQLRQQAMDSQSLAST